ncbi:MAG: isocitrate dehydrogenase (NADP(+)) [Thermoplasmata archaeon]
MKTDFEHISYPEGGVIQFKAEDHLMVPEKPVIPYIEGDGIGPDIWKAARFVFDEAILKAYRGKRAIVWIEIFAGEKAQKMYGKELLPDDTLLAIQRYAVAIKGPLATPVARGYRSLNVALRQRLDLYACVRPVRYIPGVPTPVRNPERINLVIFRENTEDVYAGIEWPADSPGATRMVNAINELLSEEGKPDLSPHTAIGIKPMSELNSRRLIRRAIRYALENSFPSVTLVHKGNIMKYTEGAFKEWGYAIAREEFGEVTLTESELIERYRGKVPEGKVIINDRIVDSMFQELLLRPKEYSVIATTNLNGDYLSDAAATQVGGLGIAPGYNIGDKTVLFEAIHGTAPKIAGLDIANPTGLILSGVEMLRFMGWEKAANLILNALTKTIGEGLVTNDLAQQMEDATEVKCSEFAAAIVERLQNL